MKVAVLAYQQTWTSNVIIACDCFWFWPHSNVQIL